MFPRQLFFTMTVFTKWPRLPDPRPGHFGSKGHTPATTLPWKIRFDNTLNTDPLFSWLNDGAVLEVYSSSITEVVYWTRSFDPLAARCFVTVKLRNPNEEIPNFISVRWEYDFQVLTLPWWFARFDAQRPPGGFVPDQLFVNYALPNLIPMAGLLTVTPVSWETPSTVVG